MTLIFSLAAGGFGLIGSDIIASSDIGGKLEVTPTAFDVELRGIEGPEVFPGLSQKSPK
jgi:hypothetical protein